MKLKNRKRRRFIKIGIIFLIFFFPLFFFSKVVNNATNYLLTYAESEVKRLATTVINMAIENDSFQILKQEELYNITKNNNNEIEMVDYNSIIVNEFLNQITNSLQISLLELENGKYRGIEGLDSNSGILFYIPLGIVTNNVLFNNLGPKIPVKIKLIGSLQTNINTYIKEYGINNAFMEMTVFLEVDMQVLLPIVSKRTNITNEVPVAYKLINGKIPNYYGESGLRKSSNIYTVPLE